MVRTAAAQAIEGIGTGSREAIPTLINTLGDRDWRVRYRSIGTLVKIGEPAVPALMQVINHNDSTVRQGVVEAFGEMQVTDPEIIASVASLLKDKEEMVRGKAADALRNIGKDAIPILVESYEKSNSEMKILIMSAIGGIGADAQTAIPKITEILKGGKPNERSEAARALGKIGIAKEMAISALVGALADSKSIVRRESALSLGKLGPAASDAVPALVEALGDKKPDVRWRASEAFGRIGVVDSNSIEVLQELLHDEHDYVSEAAQETLDLLGK
jgi:HEAT repeat protein